MYKHSSGWLYYKYDDFSLSNSPFFRRQPLWTCLLFLLFSLEGYIPKKSLEHMQFEAVII